MSDPKDLMPDDHDPQPGPAQEDPMPRDTVFWPLPALGAFIPPIFVVENPDPADPTAPTFVVENPDPPTDSPKE